ncbi:ATP-binding cassette domain-containing protein [Aeromicrobium sp. Leaf350]|uniref:ATP-binding cassette domain-containing protein n=1 Tax=Aeromicrobium sp. Leaf350 TaxID=2876565 RepID=UPI001E45D40E|nr:ATP-binding cassette domain-containing protein [Aeromicrobium sp. Leaf350]
MSSTLHPAVVLDGLTFTWPDGTTVLDGVSGTFGRGTTGLVGANGVGKSTLLRLVLGELTPTAGSVTVDGEVAHLDQFVHRLHDATVADLLGVRAVAEALAAIEAGSTDPSHFDAVGDAWDVHERSEADLAAIGLDSLTLDRPLTTLSGGEIVLTALVGLRRDPAAVTVLDEPTNNLDRATRARVHDLVGSWPGALVVVSHDVALLDRMDATAELHRAPGSGGTLTTFGGGYSAWREHLLAEQEAAEQTLRTAEQKLRAEKRQRQEVETRLAHRSKQGAKAAREKRVPKILLNTRKFKSENSMAKVRGTQEARIDEARQAVDTAAEAVRDDRTIRIDLPDPHLSPRRRLVELTSGEHVVEMRGSERVALVGRNGIGKTRLLRQLVHGGPGGAEDQPWAQAFTDRIGHLDQRLDDFDETASVLDTVRAACPQAPPEQVRGQLARFLLRGDQTSRPMSTLSGGERFRVALARLLLAEPAHELLVLDEPTNNLDLDSIDALVSALASSRSGLLVVSHDDAFLERLGVDRWLELTASGLREAAGPDDLGIPEDTEEVD